MATTIANQNNSTNVINNSNESATQTAAQVTEQAQTAQAGSEVTAQVSTQAEVETTNSYLKKLLGGVAESSITTDDLYEYVVALMQGAKMGDGVAIDNIDRLRISTATASVAKRVNDAYRAAAREEALRLYGSASGDHLHHNGRIRLYETRSYTWENVHMDDEELRQRNALYRQIQDAEEQTKVMKAKLKGLDESLAIRFPDSKAIHVKPIISIL